MRSRPRRAIWLALSLVLAVAISCRSESGAGTPASLTPTPPPITASEVVERSAESMKSVQSFRFRLSHTAGSTMLPGGISLEGAEGAAVAPDRLQVSADVAFGRSFAKLNAIVIGDDSYVTNPLTGGWLESPPGGSPFSTFDPGALVGGILASVTEVRFADGPMPAGGTYRISGSAGAAILEPLVGEVDATRTVQFDLRIDAGTFRLSHAEISGAVSQGEEPATVRVFDLSDYDAKIDIKPPI